MKAFNKSKKKKTNIFKKEKINKNKLFDMNYFDLINSLHKDNISNTWVWDLNINLCLLIIASLEHYLEYASTQIYINDDLEKDIHFVINSIKAYTDFEGDCDIESIDEYNKVLKNLTKAFEMLGKIITELWI